MEILGASAIAVKTGIARMPEGLGWAGLALEGYALDAAKVGVLAGSVLCGALGILLRLVGPKPPAR